MNSFLEVGQELKIKFLAKDNNLDVLSNVNGIKPEKGDFDNGKELLCNTMTESIQDMFLYEEECDDVEKIDGADEIDEIGISDKLNISKKHKKEDDCFACNECDVVTSCKGSLYRHKKSIHLKERFPCDDCNSILRRKDQLKQHVVCVHEGKRYSCDQCQFIAMYPQMVTSHKKKVHC